MTMPNKTVLYTFTKLPQNMIQFDKIQTDLWAIWIKLWCIKDYSLLVFLTCINFQVNNNINNTTQAKLQTNRIPLGPLVDKNYK